MLVLIIICAVAALILFINIDGLVKFEHEHSTNQTSLFVRVGFVKFGIPLEKKKTEKIKSEKQKPEKQCDENGSDDGIAAKVRFYIRLINELKGNVFDILDYLLRRGIDIRRLDIAVKLGTGDAAVTGVLYGTVCAVLYNIMAVVHNNVRVRKWDIDTEPDFDNEVLSAQIECIVRTRVVHIIVIAIKGIKLILKYKKFQGKD